SLYRSAGISWASAGSGAATAQANWSRYSEITVPLVVLNGSADKVASPQRNQRFVDSVRSADRRLDVIEGGRHMLLDDPPASAQTMLLLEEWLKRHIPPRAVGR